MRKVICLIFVVLVSGCATGYQKYTWSGGYKDKDLGEGKYEVEYLGNGTSSPPIVLERWHKRSSELCVNGYDVIFNNAGENNSTSAAFVGAALVPLSFSHPWVKGEIQCKKN